MTYYIVMDNKVSEDLWDENILGEESFGTFYAGNGFKALNNIQLFFYKYNVTFLK